MSNLKEDFQKKMQEDSDLRKKQKEIERFRTDAEYERTIVAKEEIAKTSEMDLSRVDNEYVTTVQKDNEDYIKAARDNIELIKNVPEFKAVAPFFRKNLIVVGAVSGEGKSTACANICLSVLSQGKRPLVITNEEAVEDVYNRVTCLIKGWPYQNHDRFTDEQIKTFNEYVKILSQRMTVVDAKYAGHTDLTTSIEGVKGVLDNLVKSEYKYDAIIVDYYQNIDRSIREPNLSKPAALERVASYFDNFKNTYPAPIVVMAQLKTSGEKNGTHFKDRLEWSRSLYNKATAALEIKADKKGQRTEWTVHKGRFSEFTGDSFFTGYEKGRYVPFNADFLRKLEQKQMDMLQRKQIFSK